jgi:hypothetical protein
LASSKTLGKSPIDGTFAQADNTHVGAPQTPGLPKMLQIGIQALLHLSASGRQGEHRYGFAPINPRHFRR